MSESDDDRDKAFGRFVSYWSKQTPEEKSRLVAIILEPLNKRKDFQRKTFWDYILSDELLV